MLKKILKYTAAVFIFILASCQTEFNLDNLLRDAVISDKLIEPDPETLTIPQPQKPWTIMIYMDGDNSLSPATEYDLYELLGAGGSSSYVNIVAMVDQNPNYPTYGGGTRHGIYYVGHTKYFLVKDMPELDTGEGMGTLDTANYFLSFVNTYFRADHYMFVFWNHGNGVDRSLLSAELSFPPRNVGGDETQTSGDPTLTEIEQQTIIQNLKTIKGGNVDIVAYDACLMGMAEIMYQMRNVADYFAGSEDNVPGAGYDYGFISQIRNNPGITALEIGQHIVNYYSNVYLDPSYYYVTLSFIDLSYMGGSETTDLGYMINDFAAAAIATGIAQKTYYYEIRTSLDNSRFPLQIPGYSYFYDLYEFMNGVNNHPLIDSAVKAKAVNIMNLISGTNLVKYSYKGVGHSDALNTDANGISIYIDNPTTSYVNNHDLMSGSTAWDDFLTWAEF